jgi:hypothetical protein
VYDYSRCVGSPIIEVLKQHHIIDYYRYVDDILIIYNTHITHIDNTLAELNSMHPRIQFTLEKEADNKLNYLNLTIRKETDRLTFDIYRKPTSTDLIIHNDSCHRHEHKRSAINFLLNRVNKYPIAQRSKDREMQTISVIKQESL